MPSEYPGLDAKHRLLILPFTPSTLSSPSALLPLIYTSVRSSASLESLLIYFSTPHADRSASWGEQLYDTLRHRPRETWDAFHRFLSEVYATLAAAQWEGAAEGQGKVGMQ